MCLLSLLLVWHPAHSVLLLSHHAAVQVETLLTQQLPCTWEKTLRPPMDDSGREADCGGLSVVKTDWRTFCAEDAIHRLRVADCVWRTVCGGLRMADCVWRTVCSGLPMADCVWRTLCGGLSVADSLWRTRCGGLSVADSLRQTLCGRLSLADSLWQTLCGGLRGGDCL